MEEKNYTVLVVTHVNEARSVLTDVDHTTRQGDLLVVWYRSDKLPTSVVIRNAIGWDWYTEEELNGDG